MAKKAQKTEKTSEKSKDKLGIAKDPDYLIRMSHAPATGAVSPIYQMLPLMLFAVVTIVIVRLHVYKRPMSQFYWTPASDTTQLLDFFSYYKMVFLVAMCAIAVFLFAVRFASQSLIIKRSAVYIPLAIYCLGILISYFGSNYKEFALLGFNDRFEGTIPLLCYCFMLFFAINTVNSEKNAKQLFTVIAIVSVVLSLIGLSQAFGKDIFRTALAQKLISPNYSLVEGQSLWAAIDESFANGESYYSFEFNNGEIYQTVYNINYVSFYLTMLIPLFGMLFIRSLNKDVNTQLWKKIGLGILCILLIFNLIFSRSSGGYLGIGVAIILGIIVLNKKLKKYWKPIIVIIVTAVIVLGASISIWLPEITGAVSSLSRQNYKPIVTSYRYEFKPAYWKCWIDYIETGDRLLFSINGEPIIADFDIAEYGISLNLRDKDDAILPLVEMEDGYYFIDDDRFYDYAKIAVGLTEDENAYLIITTSDLNWNPVDWIFVKEGNQVYYLNEYGKKVTLGNIQHSLFSDHLSLGSGRGYIWATSIPLLKRTIIKGYGADTFCITFPQNDYAWKYNTGYDRTIVVDKPHNMYIQTAVNTGVISMIAFISICIIYIIQSIKLYRSKDFGSDFLSYAGFGLFCGLCGFIVSGLVNDSSVSVMPLFYSLLGTGIAINSIIKNKADAASR